jgi:hypothetical protein
LCICCFFFSWHSNHNTEINSLQPQKYIWFTFPYRQTMLNKIVDATVFSPILTDLGGGPLHSPQSLSPYSVHCVLGPYRATTLRAGRPGFHSQQGKQIFLYATASRPVLRPTQPPIQLVPGVKWPACQADHSPPPSAEAKNGGTIPPLPQTSS